MKRQTLGALLLGLGVSIADQLPEPRTPKPAPDPAAAAFYRAQRAERKRAAFDKRKPKQ